jgi:hypothetical protein
VAAFVAFMGVFGGGFGKSAYFCVVIRGEVVVVLW